MKYSIYGGFTAKAGSREELVDILLKAAKILEENKDCFHYLVSTTVNEPNKVCVFESWTDKASHDAALDPVEIKQLIQQAMPLIEKMDQQFELDLLGGKSEKL